MRTLITELEVAARKVEVVGRYQGVHGLQMGERAIEADE